MFNTHDFSDSVLDHGTGIKIDWKESKAIMAEESKKRSNSKPKLLRRKSSKKSLTDSQSIAESTATSISPEIIQSILPAPPRLVATKVLLDNYVKGIERSLEGAKESNILR